MGTELPTTVQARCYTDLGRFTTNLADCENEDTHGTIVAESVMDIAPEVSLYVALPQSQADLSNIVNWMMGEGVSVINTSVGWLFDGPGDGTSPYSISPLRTVDRAVGSGAIWVSIAHNHAQTTWFGSPLDADDDGFFAFSGTDETNDLLLEAGQTIRVQLRWEGIWGQEDTDLDMILYDSNLNPVWYSGDYQSGPLAGDFPIPWDYIEFDVPRDGVYHLSIDHFSGPAPDWIQLTVWDVKSIEHYTKNGSITNPGESANTGMLAVGAAHWNDVRAIERYSSRGPTPDGRVKPDIVGAACGATALMPLNEYNSGFCGTSQAAPHVAGMAALVRQRFPDYTPAQVASYLKDFAEQRQAPDPNNTWGHGFAKLPPPTGEAQPTPPALSTAFARDPAAEFNGLQSAGNTWPTGIWSDGTTMWVADNTDDKIYAYDLVTKARVPGMEFNTLQAAGNTVPLGIWSDESTMWVTDYADGKVYAYDLDTKARVPSQDFDALVSAGNTEPVGIWSDGATMWVTDWRDKEIYAYDLATKARVSGQDFDALKAARNRYPTDIWSDGSTMWVTDSYLGKIYAYDLATKARVPGMEFNTLEAAGNTVPESSWSDGTTMWVADRIDGKIYAYRMPADGASNPPAVVFGNSPTWTSAQLQTEIARYVVEHGYGYDTEKVPGDQISLLQGLRGGDIHLSMEVWPSTFIEQWESALFYGDILDLGSQPSERLAIRLRDSRLPSGTVPRTGPC